MCDKVNFKRVQILTEILWVKEVSSWKKVLFCLLNFYSMNIEGFGLALFSQNFNKKDQIKISHQLILEAFASIFFIFYLTFLLLHPKKSSNNISKRACSVFILLLPGGVTDPPSECQSWREVALSTSSSSLATPPYTPHL